MLFVFDVNETLLDLSSLDHVFARHAGRADLRADWFELMIRAALVATAADQYRDFAVLGADAARATAQAAGTSMSEAAVAELASTLRELPAHPEVPDGLRRLRQGGHRLVALANSPKRVVAAQLDHAELTPLLDGVYSAEDAGALKPAPAAYSLVLDAEHTPAADTVLVAAHDWDIAGAQAAGLRTVYLTRSPRTPLPGWPTPDLSAPDLTTAITSMPWR